MWRLIVEQVATMGEVSGKDATYSLVDIHKANALLDMRADLNQPKESPK